MAKVIYDTKLNKTTKHVRVRALERISTDKYVEIGYMKLSAAGKVVVDGQKVVKIDWIYVDPDSRGKGIATGLYKKAAEFACSLGMVLASDEMLRPATRKFWEKQRKAGNARKKVSSKGVGIRNHRYLLSCPARINPPDEEMRRLERLAAQGDVDAERKLEGMRFRLIEHAPPALKKWQAYQKYGWRWETNREPPNNPFPGETLIYYIQAVFGQGERKARGYTLSWYPEPNYHTWAWHGVADIDGHEAFKTPALAAKFARNHYKKLFAVGGKKSNPPTGDENLRKLERLAAQGDSQARQRLITERLRAGTISERRVVIAAKWFNDKAAQEYYPLSGSWDLEAWQGIRELELDTIAQIGILALKQAYPGSKTLKKHLKAWSKNLDTSELVVSPAESWRENNLINIVEGIINEVERIRVLSIDTNATASTLAKDLTLVLDSITSDYDHRQVSWKTINTGIDYRNRLVSAALLGDPLPTK